jgi:phosphoribosylanthranilate isomerase
MHSARASSVALEPVAPRDREPILDALRGFAILGILLVNIEVMRGPGWLLLLGGESVAPGSPGERLVPFIIGWFGTGKFLSSLAILFGVGAALIAERSLAAEQSPRRLLARRYAWLMLFGAAHMLLYDAPAKKLPGGTGLSFDWSLLTAFKHTMPWGLAGGLTPATVADAIRTTGAALVDTSSGVESAPGVKDVDKIAAFCQAAREA